MKSPGRLLILPLLAATTSFAGGAGTTGGNGLKLPAAARPTALGGAFVGLADDPAALLWNPAGLAFVRTPEAAFMHAPYVADTSFEVMSYAQPLGPLGTAAGSLHLFNYGTLLSTTDRGGVFGGVNGSTAPSDLFLMAGWGTALPPLFGMDRLKAGATAKFTMQQLTAGTAVGVGLTGGALWDTPVEGLRVGTTLDNLGGTSGDGSVLPISWVAGASYARVMSRDVRATGLLDLRAAIDTGLQAALGLEVTAYRLFTVRAGWRGGGALGGITLGGGIQQPVNWLGRTMVFKLDIAHADAGELGSSQRFQLGVQLGVPDTAAVKPVVVAPSAPAAAVVVAHPAAPPTEVSGLALSREGADTVLVWTGPGPAYHVLLRKIADREYFWLTVAPVTSPRYPLLGIPPGTYDIKVRTVDPANPDWKGVESADFEFTLEATNGAPVPAAPVPTVPR